jgi:myosin heavy subunit
MNQRCLVAHPSKIWCRARLSEKNDQIVKVITDDGDSLEVKLANYCEIGENSFDPVSDLCLLDELHAGLIYDHLKERYFKDEIYTYIGPIVVSVNPFCKLDNIPGTLFIFLILLRQ